jgi:hypothetical protein
MSAGCSCELDQPQYATSQPLPTFLLRRVDYGSMVTTVPRRVRYQQRFCNTPGFGVGRREMALRMLCDAATQRGDRDTAVEVCSEYEMLLAGISKMLHRPLVN